MRLLKKYTIGTVLWVPNVKIDLDTGTWPTYFLTCKLHLCFFFFLFFAFSHAPKCAAPACNVGRHSRAFLGLLLAFASSIFASTILPPPTHRSFSPSFHRLLPLCLLLHLPLHVSQLFLSRHDTFYAPLRTCITPSAPPCTPTLANPLHQNPCSLRTTATFFLDLEFPCVQSVGASL